MSFTDSVQTTEPHHESSTASPQQLTSEIQSFDYTVLTPEVRTVIQNKTSELKTLMRRSVQDIIDIGQKLIEVKEKLGHGNFSTWLKAEFGWSVRTAARFMQVATQFKFANLANLNIAVSALYLLAEPSTSEKARQQALELAKQGDNITHSKAKRIVNGYQEQAQPNVFNPENTDNLGKSTEGNSYAPFEPCKFPQTYSQLEPTDQANLMVIGQTVEIIPSTECDKKSEQKTIEKINCFPSEKSEVAVELQLEPSNHIRILNIDHHKPELATSTAQTFDLTFAGIHVDFEGYPEALIILFEQMRNNPTFSKKILYEARLLATHKKEKALLSPEE